MTEYELKKSFTFYVKNAILKEFFGIAESISSDGNLLFERDTVSIVELNSNNTSAIQLRLDLSENLKNDVYFKNKKRYFIDFNEVNKVLEAFKGDDFDFFKCSIDESKQIFIIESTSCEDGNIRRGFVPIYDGKSRRKVLDELDTKVKKYLNKHTFMQIRVNCGELYSAIKTISNLHYNAYNEGVAIMGSNDGLIISSTIPEESLNEGSQFKVPYFSTLIRFDADYLNETTFVGIDPDIQFAGTLFCHNYLEDFLKKLPPNFEVQVSVGNNYVGMFESNVRNLHILYLVAPFCSKMACDIIDDAYAKSKMFIGKKELR